MIHKIRFAQAPDIGSQELTEEIIRKRAYELFELHGCEHGHDVEHWLDAEGEVLGKKAGSSADAEKYATHRDSAA
jgi:Protein of unknown function (DUF2934)